MSEDTLTAAQAAARSFGKGAGSQDDLQKALDVHSADEKPKPKAKAATRTTAAKSAEGSS